MASINNRISTELILKNEKFRVQMKESGKQAEALRRNVNNATRSVSRFEEASRTAAQTVAVFEGPLGGIAGRFSALATAAKLLKSPITYIVGAMGTLAATSAKGLAVFQEYEMVLGRLDGVLQATGNTAGKTSQQIEEMAQVIAADTLESVDGALAASAALATFGTVTGDNFERLLYLSADITAVFGGNLTSNVRKLGKAFEDPVQGMSELQEAGLKLTESQKETIRYMKRTGQSAKAAEMLIGELEERMSGAAVEQGQGLAGQLDLLMQNSDNFFRRFVEITGIAELATKALGGLATAVGILADKMLPKTVAEYRKEISRLTKDLDESTANKGGRSGAAERKRIRNELREAKRGMEQRLVVEQDMADEQLLVQMEATAKANQIRKEQDAFEAAAQNKKFQKLLNATKEHTIKMEAIDPLSSTAAEDAENRRYASVVSGIEKRQAAVHKDFQGNAELALQFEAQREEAYQQHQLNMTQIHRDALYERQEQESDNFDAMLKWLDAEKKADHDRFAAKAELADATGMLAQETMQMIANSANEGSNVQRAAFAIEKGIAVARASLNVAVAASDAMATTPGPAKWIAYAQAVVAGANLLSTINSITISGSRASGGDIRRPGNYIVGEMGREIVNLPGGSSVTPIGNAQPAAINVQVIESNERAGEVSQMEGGVQVYVQAFKNQFMSDVNNGRGMARAMEQRYGLQRRAGA